MKLKGETIQKLVLFGAVAVSAIIVSEGYLRTRAFLVRVDELGRQVSILRHQVDVLQVQLDVTPRPGASAIPPFTSIPNEPVMLPLPEPMLLPSPGADRRVKPVRTGETPASAAADAGAKGDAVPDDGQVVLMKDVKPAPPQGQPQGSPAVEVKLWTAKK